MHGRPPLRRVPLLAAFAAPIAGVGVVGLWQMNAWLLAALVPSVVLAIYVLRMPTVGERFDPRSGLYDAVSFTERVREEVARARRFQRPFAILVADLDHLREINDDYGRTVGDAVLAGFARLVRTEIRSVDLPARLGDEEFGVLLPETTQEAALEVAERLRAAMASRALGAGVPATVSLGVAAFPDDGGTFEELMAAAERAVDAAKGAGRDRVERAGTVHVFAP